MQAKAYAAPSFTFGSNSSRQVTKASKAPASITHCAKCSECFATDFNTNAAAFL